MDAFRSRMRAPVRARKEEEATDEARAEVRTRSAAEGSDDDTAPPNEFYEFLNEVCEEVGYES